MAIFHVDASVITKGKSPGGAVGFASYLTGAERGNATRMQQYLEREGHSREDLVASGAGALPAWARDGAHFFAMADRFERHGGVVARHYQITIPRELSPAGRRALAEDMRAAFFERYPHVWALHCPQARDGSGDQPHLHVMFSTRREDSPRHRTPKQWFARAAEEGQDPLQGGVRKDRIWDRKHQLQAVRAEAATLINAALDRESVPQAVSHERRQVRGLDDTGRAEENLTNLRAWQQQKEREHIDIDRHAVLDLVRDRFWAHDHSTVRRHEQEASWLRTLEREALRRGWHHPRFQERPQDRGQRRGVAHGLGLDDEMHGGVHLKLDDRGHER